MSSFPDPSAVSCSGVMHNVSVVGVQGNIEGCCRNMNWWAINSVLLMGIGTRAALDVASFGRFPSSDSLGLLAGPVRIVLRRPLLPDRTGVDGKLLLLARWRRRLLRRQER